MEIKLKVELMESVNELRQRIKDKKISLAEVQKRVRTFNKVIESQGLAKLALFYPKKEDQFVMLSDHIAAITLKGLEKL